MRNSWNWNVGGKGLLVSVTISVNGNGDVKVVIRKSSLVLVVHVVVDCSGAVFVIVGRVDVHQQRSD